MMMAGGDAGIAGAPLYEGRLYTGCGRNNMLHITVIQSGSISLTFLLDELSRLFKGVKTYE